MSTDEQEKQENRKIQVKHVPTAAAAALPCSAAKAGSDKTTGNVRV